MSPARTGVIRNAAVVNTSGGCGVPVAHYPDLPHTSVPRMGLGSVVQEVRAAPGQEIHRASNLGVSQVPVTRDVHAMPARDYHALATSGVRDVHGLQVRDYQAVSIAGGGPNPLASRTALSAGSNNYIVHPTLSRDRHVRSPGTTKLSVIGPDQRVLGEKPISREELFSTGNLVTGEATQPTIGIPGAVGKSVIPAIARNNDRRIASSSPVSSPRTTATILERDHWNYGVEGVATCNSGASRSGTPIAII